MPVMGSWVATRANGRKGLWLEMEVKLSMHLKQEAKPKVLRFEENFIYRSLGSVFSINMVTVIGTIPAVSATASFLCLFLIIFIKTSDTAKHTLAEVILLAAKMMLTKYAALKLNIYRKKTWIFRGIYDNILHEYYSLVTELFDMDWGENNGKCHV